MTRQSSAFALSIAFLALIFLALAVGAGLVRP